MSASLRTEAIVLRIVSFGESDRIVHLLTPATGRLTAIAKGARRSVKRFPGTLDFFNQLEIQVARRKPGAMARLESAKLSRAFERFRDDPARFALGCFLLELLDRLAPEGGARRESEALYRFALEALEALEARRPDARTRIFLELRALQALGVRPSLERCVRCGERAAGPDPVAFHVSEGGVLCNVCETRVDVPLRFQPGTLRALEQGLRFPLDRIERLGLSPTALNEARTLLSRFQRFHLGVELRSERFLDEVLGGPPPAV